MRHIAAVGTVLFLAAIGGEAAQIDSAAEPALVIGSDGRGLVAYQDTASLDLKVAHCVDAACTAVTTVTVDSAGDVGSRAAIALLPGGLPVISYADVTNNSIKLAFCADTVCSSATTVVVESGLLPGGSGHTSVAIGGDGRPLVAYTTGIPASEDNGRLHVAHCSNPGCTSATVSNLAAAQQEAALAIGGDGRGVIVSVRRFDTDLEVDFHHCNDVECTSASVAPRPAAEIPTVHFNQNPSLAVGPDGLATFTYTVRAGFGIGLQVVKCLDFACTTFTLQRDVAQATGPSSMAIDATGRPRVVVAHLGISAPAQFGEAQLFECNDATCTTYQQACTAPWANHPSLALDGAGQPLVAVEVPGRVAILRPGSCQPTFFIDTITHSYEGNPPDPGFLMPFPVRLFPPSITPVTVAYATADVTAQAGSDYLGASGLVTFAPGETAQVVYVRTIPDATVEPDETFQVVLSAPGGTPIAQGVAVGRIANDDSPPQPTVDVADCGVTEGNSGTTGCRFDVRLAFTYPGTVTVDFATSNGTAVAGADYLMQSGTLTFAAGATSQTITVSVVGDLATEPDEFFHLTLSQPVNALPGDMFAVGTIVDDDWPLLPGMELTHGSALVADFQPDPGPTADRDDYRVALAPYSSYEAVLDAVSGDAAPGATLERVAADGTTVLDVGGPVGTGSATSLRVVNAIAASVTTQYLRVRGASCGTACGPDDTYRIRLYETTGRIPRFNNSATQVTVLILQNTTGNQMLADAHFWGAGGEHLATQSLLIQPRGTFVLNTSTLASLLGTSGSITVTHNAPYAALAGKAVALEPATGFSFDSPMVLKPR